MSSIAFGLQMILQIFPLGHWLSVSPYGIVYGTLLIDALCCLILLLSKAVFKEYFSSKLRKRIFLTLVGGTALLTIACYMFVTMKVVPVLYYRLPDPDFSYLLPVYYGLILIAYVFFISYFVDFIIRLIRHRKQKSQLIAEETKID